MTDRAIKNWHKLTKTMICMVLFTMGLDSLSAIYDRNELRQARKLAAAEKQQIRDTPIIAWFEYLSVEPLRRDNTNNNPLPIQSAGVVRQAVTIEHDDRLFCKPLGEAEAGWRQISRLPDKVRKDGPELMGPIDTPKGMESVERSDGQWSYTGALPTFDATCYLQSQPCIWPHPQVEKCLPKLISGQVTILVARVNG